MKKKYHHRKGRRAFGTVVGFLLLVLIIGFILQYEKIEHWYADFIALVKKKIIDAGLRGHICGDCSWDYICREKEACLH